MSNSGSNFERRDFLKTGAAAGAAAAVATMPGTASANRHPHPNPGSQKELDRNSYINNMEVIAHYSFPSKTPGEHVGNEGKSSIMAIGKTRYLFQDGNVFDITDPRKVALVSEGTYRGGQPQLVYNRTLKKWILMVRSGTPNTTARPDAPNGKYDDPKLIERALNWKGLRGVSIYDATDPKNVKHLADWSVDQGDPTREVQTGGGTHRNWYLGGRYAYLDAGFDNNFTRMENPARHHTFGIQTIDLSDPAKPKWVSNWWIPGQRDDEVVEYKKWRFAGDKLSWTCTHGPAVVPQNVEEGGKYGYTCYGHFGMMVHDFSNPKEPKLVGKFDPKPIAGGIPFHTADVVRLDKGFIIASPETLNPDCNEPYQDVYIVDVRDPTNPTAISRLPRPQTPPNAPYDTFCNKRGRYGTHNPPHENAPGKPHPTLTMYSCFNAGLQMHDISRLDAPKIVGYFISPQGGTLAENESFARDMDNVIIEWDRNIIYAMTNTGMYVLSAPALGKPNFDAMEVKEWALPNMNRGHDAIRG